ncbi:MAG TPA: hypothetical protein DCE62_05140, partial [Glaciecola sp.]|nr:hypothetical protein [Glaciecola sp.]
VNSLLKQLTQMQKMMKKRTGGGMGKMMNKMKGMMPPGGGMPPGIGGPGGMPGGLPPGLGGGSSTGGLANMFKKRK